MRTTKYIIWHTGKYFSGILKVVKIVSFVTPENVFKSMTRIMSTYYTLYYVGSVTGIIEHYKELFSFYN